MTSNEFDFFSQLFGQAPLLPICILGLGTAYIAMMVVIFRRASERRRRARSYRLGDSPARTKPSFSRPEVPNLAAITSAASNMASSVAKAIPVPGSLLKRFQDDSGVQQPDLATLLGQKPPEPEKPKQPPQAPTAAPLAVDSLAGEPAPAISSLPVQFDAPSALMIRESDLAMTTRDNQTPNSLPDDAVELLRLWRDISDGTLLIQIGGAIYRHPTEITASDQQRRLTALVRELNSMLGDMPRPIPTPAAPSLPSVAPVLPEVAEKPKGLFNRKVAQEQPAGIADAIEAFLQARLLGSPQFATRSIHIRPTPDHGVRIEVDGHFYDAISDVIDPDVREYLETMMREWEARH